MARTRHGRTGIFKGASQTSRKRQTSQGSLSALMSLAGVTYAWDLASDVLTWGPNAHHRLGLPLKDLPQTGRAFAQLVEPGSGNAPHEAIASDGGSSGAYDTRYALRLGPDRVLMVQDAGRWHSEAHGRPAFVRGQLRAEPQSRTQDCLPALVRARSSLLLCIQNDINEALRLSHTCTLIVGALGNDQADSMAEIARMLRPMMRRHDHFTDLGANRFALTLTCCSATEAASAMRRLAGLLKDHPAASSLHLGAACSPDHTFQAAKLLRFAEQALGSGLKHGKTAVLHDSRQARPSPAREGSPLDLVVALNDRRLTLACQPMVDAQARVPTLLQACASLPAPDGRMIPLGPVPDLDDANLALLVDGRMLELAAGHLVRHSDERLVLPISPRTLQDAEWLPMLAAHLGAHPGIESRLIIEIPEIALSDSGAALGRLDTMKALGVGLALAGFGAGRVSPTQLKNLPIDLLKIDGVFIHPLKRSTEDRLFVRTLIDAAQNLGITTAAEWVDDEATARLLANWGVDYLQGVLFGSPEPVSLPLTLQQMMQRA
jgi:EAL domain-containing protein (putative c-di-GMP-specific phosphodiesterase class I)